MEVQAALGAAVDVQTGLLKQEESRAESAVKSQEELQSQYRALQIENEELHIHASKADDVRPDLEAAKETLNTLQLALEESKLATSRAVKGREELEFRYAELQVQLSSQGQMMRGEILQKEQKLRAEHMVT